MKFKILTIVLVTLFSVSDLYSQRPRKLSPKKPNTTERFNSEIQKQLTLMFEAKELQDLIANANVIRFKQFDDINKANFKDFKIRNKAFEVIDGSDANAQSNPEYFYIVAWSDVLNMLDVVIVHQATKTKIKILLTKRETIWEFGASELVTEKKPETNKNTTPARKSLRRRG